MEYKCLSAPGLPSRRQEGILPSVQAFTTTPHNLNQIARIENSNSLKNKMSALLVFILPKILQNILNFVLDILKANYIRTAQKKMQFKISWYK